MLSVGSTFPNFKLTSVVRMAQDDAFATICDNDFQDKWKVFFFWPKDFTFVCPTEIAEFGALNAEFEKRNTQVIGCSTDNEYVHLAWREQNPMLKDIPFPLMSDIKRELCDSLGILDQDAGVAQRATFVVDPQNKIRFVSVTDLSVGRNVQEVIRVLDALQTDKLTPCNWQPGEATLSS